MVKGKEKSSLEEMKKEYEKFKIKHSLPEFEKLNEDFYIERASDVETDLLLREIRKFIADRYSNYMRFVEVILNPVNAPMFIYSLIKLLGKEDKKHLEEIYKKFMEIEVKLIELDISYSEEKEAEFIKKAFVEWQEIKVFILKIVDTIQKNKGNKFEKSNGGYFG